MSWLRDRRVALTGVTLFTLLAGDTWRYLFTWFGWAAIVLALLAAWIAVAVRHRIDLRRIPIALGALVALMAVSLAWSHYPGATAIGLVTTLATAFGGVVMAHTVSLQQLLRALGSLAFEVIVGAVVQRAVLPLWVSYDEPIPRAFYWSRGLLFEGGRIQGLPGNANLLAFAALLAVIVFALQLADRRVGAAAGWAWLGAAALTLALTRSSTVLVAGIAVAIVLLVLLAARRLGLRGRLTLYAATTVAGAALITLAITFRGTLLDLVGRSADLTNRLDIWAAVTGLIEQRPVAGWGWVSYWAPWVDPFDDLIIIKGVRYLQAHNAWLDVLLQLGIVGLVIFTVLILTTGVRVLSWSVDAPHGAADPAPTSALLLLPALLFTVLVVHSLAESRLLIEVGLLLLVYLAVASRLRGVTVPVRVPMRRTPTPTDAVSS
jgi:exopolysaccharide production protein ExoQ